MKKITGSVLVIIVCCSNVWATEVEIFDDGLVHEINNPRIDYDCYVLDSYSQEPTTLNIVQGGMIYHTWVFDRSSVNVLGGAINYELYAYDDSHVTIVAGVIGAVGRDLFAHNRSQVVVSGGGLGGELHLYDDAALHMSDGTIGFAAFANNNSKLYITGGSLGTNSRDLMMYNHSELYLSGGNLRRHLVICNYSKVFMTGGVIGFDLVALDESQVVISGGWVDRYLNPKNDSIIIVLGNNFNLPLGYISNTSGILTGTLANGDSINVDFIREGSGAILLANPNMADLNYDNTVNLVDYSMFVAHWQFTNCGDINNCHGADFEPDGDVDIEDLVEFCEQWLN